MPGFFKQMIAKCRIPLIFLSVTSVFSALVWVWGMWAFGSYEQFSSENRSVPAISSAQTLVAKCEASKYYGDPHFNSSWHFYIRNGVFVRGSFECRVKEIIPWQERSRLSEYTRNPPIDKTWSVAL